MDTSRKRRHKRDDWQTAGCLTLISIACAAVIIFDWFPDYESDGGSTSGPISTAIAEKQVTEIVVTDDVVESRARLLVHISNSNNVQELFVPAETSTGDYLASIGATGASIEINRIPPGD